MAEGVRIWPTEVEMMARKRESKSKGDRTHVAHLEPEREGNDSTDGRVLIFRRLGKGGGGHQPHAVNASRRGSAPRKDARETSR